MRPRSRRLDSLVAAACLASLVSAQQLPDEPAQPFAAPTSQEPPAAPQEPERPRPEQQAPPDALPPVIVTARKWREFAQDVPQSVTAFSARGIRDAGIETVRDASQFVPNTLLTEFSSRRLSFPFVRGIGSGQGEPAVATFLDGVPQLRVSSTNLPLLDVGRIEFLRGPHGALYGRNTMGGAIHIVTSRPSAVREVDAGVTVGNYNRQDYRLHLATPLVQDELFFSASALHSRREGYTTNDLTGRDVDFRDDWFGRAQLLWMPDDFNELRFVVHADRARDGGFVLSDLDGLRARPNRIDQDFEGWADRDLFAASLTWERRLGQDLEFTSISSLQDWRIEEASDFDFSSLDGVRRLTNEDQTYFFQELRLSSPEHHAIALSDDASLSWLVGVSGFVSESSEAAANDYRPGGVGVLFPATQVGTDRAAGEFDSLAASIFGQVAIEWQSGFELTSALRYDYEEKEADLTRTFAAGGMTLPVSATSPDTSSDAILPSLSLSYRLSQSATAYGLVARGFKAGGINLTAPAGLETFGPEKSWTYELGAKTSWLDGLFEANLALFHIDWEDMQLAQFDPSSGGYQTNAGEARSRGVELELVGRPLEGVEVFGSLGFLDTRFQRFVDQWGTDVSGRDLPFAPEVTGSLGAQYSQPVGDDGALFARADWFHIGDFSYDPGNRAGESYDLANLRFGYRNERVRCEAWVRNAFDEHYVPVAIQVNPADPTMFAGESAAPVTFGLSVTVRF